MAIIMSVLGTAGVPEVPHEQYYKDGHSVVYMCTPTHKRPTLRREIAINGNTLTIYKGACYDV